MKKTTKLREEVKKMLDNPGIKKYHLEILKGFLNDAIRCHENELVKCKKCGGAFPRFFRHRCRGGKKHA